MYAPFYDWFLTHMEENGLGQWRRDLLERATGSVLEIGAGTGLNLPHYPEEIDALVLLEPDEGWRALSQNASPRWGHSVRRRTLRRQDARRAGR